MSNHSEELSQYINALWIVDTHEHVEPVEAKRDFDTDFLKEYLHHYFCCDLVSAGLSLQELAMVRDCRLPLCQRWALAERHWNVARNTGYGRALDLAVKDLYGIDGIRGDTIHALDAAFKASLQMGQYHKVLKEKSKILISIVDNVDGKDNSLQCDLEFFRMAKRFDHFIRPKTYQDILDIEMETGICIHSFQDWLDALEHSLDTALQKGLIAIKSGIAYDRDLSFGRVEQPDAEESFNAFFERKTLKTQGTNSLMPTRYFENFMMHYLLGLANKRRMVFQIHTGAFEGNGNNIRNGDMSPLYNLFLEYPDVKFDVFHMSYPYQHLSGIFGKSFPNVYLDMCWAHLLSPTAAICTLTEWLDTVPLNKMLAFGGDFRFIDGIYAHQIIARKNVAKALDIKIDQGFFSLNDAMCAARMMFRDNPLALYGLTETIQ